MYGFAETNEDDSQYPLYTDPRTTREYWFGPDEEED